MKLLVVGLLLGVNEANALGLKT